MQKEFPRGGLRKVGIEMGEKVGVRQVKRAARGVCHGVMNPRNKVNLLVVLMLPLVKGG